MPRTGQNGENDNYTILYFHKFFEADWLSSGSYYRYVDYK